MCANLPYDSLIRYGYAACFPALCLRDQEHPCLGRSLQMLRLRVDQLSPAQARREAETDHESPRFRNRLDFLHFIVGQTVRGPFLRARHDAFLEGRRDNVLVPFGPVEELADTVAQEVPHG